MAAPATGPRRLYASWRRPPEKDTRSTTAFSITTLKVSAVSVKFLEGEVSAGTAPAGAGAKGTGAGGCGAWPGGGGERPGRRPWRALPDGTGAADLARLRAGLAGRKLSGCRSGREAARRAGSLDIDSNALVRVVHQSAGLQASGGCSGSASSNTAPRGHTALAMTRHCWPEACANCAPTDSCTPTPTPPPCSPALGKRCDRKSSQP